MKVRFEGPILFLDDKSWKLDHAIRDAFELGGKAIVLFEPDEVMNTFGQFHNLVAIDGDGTRTWEAELPTTITGDRYYKVVRRIPLVAYSVQSYDCQIDPATGRIVDRTFTK